METNWLSIIPVVLTILLAFSIRNVFVALITGILASGLILDFETGTFLKGIMSIPAVFQDSWSSKSILFCLLIGAFVYIIEASGGVEGLVNLLTEKKKVIKSRVGAQLIAYIIGLILFIDGTSSIVISGVAARSFFDKYQVSRQKLAYIIDSTSSPIAFLSPITGAGAFLMAMMGSQVSAGIITGDPFSYVLSAVPLQLYNIISIIIVGVTIFMGREMGPMKNPVTHLKSDFQVVQTNQEDSTSGKPKAKNMVVPILFFVTSFILTLYLTGGKNLLKGDAATAIFAGTFLTLVITGLFYYFQGIVTIKEYTSWCMKGMAKFLDVTVILTLAFAFSNLLSELGTGMYIASLSKGISAEFIPLIVFLIGTVISFSTGTSGGTVAVLIPIAIPVAVSLNVNVPLILGAVVSGAVFGDHSSPVSDSTILSSMIAEVHVMDHVKTQLPYAILGAVLSSLGYLILGFLM